jgi:hypothetical protein
MEMGKHPPGARKWCPMISAILGVLKAGKIYVPLDPSLHGKNPLYSEDSQADFIVTNKNLSIAESLLECASTDQHGRVRPSLKPKPRSLYNPGHPCLDSLPPALPRSKEIVHSHRNLLHFVMNYTNGFRICADDRLTLLIPVASMLVPTISFCLAQRCRPLPVDIKRRSDPSGRLAHTDYHLQFRPNRLSPSHRRIDREENFSPLRLIKMMGEPV